MIASPPFRRPCSRFAAAGVAAALLSVAAGALADPLVIAHRGASAYLPEHTLESKVLAHVMGADFIEQDVVLSGDGHPLVLHDIYLDAVTNVAAKFPGRAREDGRHYAVDFTLEEIRTLRVNERIDLETGAARYPGRFPVDANPFRIHTLGEELQLIRGLNERLRRDTGVYVELKDPAWHERAGLDIGKVVLDTLARHGYDGAAGRAYIQSFDPRALRRLKEEFGTTIPLVQLIGENRWWPESGIDFEAMRTPDGLARIAGYAAGIGPWIGQVLVAADAAAAPRLSTLAADAHAAGLLVHAYTIRADRLPRGFDDIGKLLGRLFDEAGVDGVFTDFPDQVRAFLDASS